MKVIVQSLFGFGDMLIKLPGGILQYPFLQFPFLQTSALCTPSSSVARCAFPAQTVNASPRIVTPTGVHIQSKLLSIRPRQRPCSDNYNTAVAGPLDKRLMSIEAPATAQNNVPTSPTQEVCNCVHHIKAAY